MILLVWYFLNGFTLVDISYFGIFLMLQNFWQEKRNEGKLHVLMHKVKNLRDEIEVWWEKCFISEDEKQTFEVYKSTNYTSELYDCHVEELKRMKRKFYRNE